MIYDNRNDNANKNMNEKMKFDISPLHSAHYPFQDLKRAIKHTQTKVGKDFILRLRTFSLFLKKIKNLPLSCPVMTGQDLKL